MTRLQRIPDVRVAGWTFIGCTLSVPDELTAEDAAAAAARFVTALGAFELLDAGQVASERARIDQRVAGLRAWLRFGRR